MDEIQKKRICVVAAVIEREDRYLITQRRASAVLPLMWEFPGGRVETGETHAEALVREIAFRLDAKVLPKELISKTSHAYPSYILDLYLYSCDLLSETVTPRNVNDLRWVRSEEFETVSFTPADEASVSRLLGERNDG